VHKVLLHNSAFLKLHNDRSTTIIIRDRLLQSSCVSCKSGLGFFYTKFFLGDYLIYFLHTGYEFNLLFTHWL